MIDKKRIKDVRRLYYITNRLRMIQYSKNYYHNKKKLFNTASAYIKLITYNNDNKKLFIISFD